MRPKLAYVEENDEKAYGRESRDKPVRHEALLHSV